MERCCFMTQPRPLSLALACTVASLSLSFPTRPARAAGLGDRLKSRVEAEYSSLETLYQDFHAHPELSFREEKTAAKLAAELKNLGLEVATAIGGHGVVGVLRNGAGPT